MNFIQRIDYPRKKVHRYETSVMYIGSAYTIKFYLTETQFTPVCLILNSSLYLELLVTMGWVFFNYIPWLPALLKKMQEPDVHELILASALLQRLLQRARSN